MQCLNFTKLKASSDILDPIEEKNAYCGETHARKKKKSLQSEEQLMST